MDKTAFFNGLADVLEAGAKKSRNWIYNNDRQQNADVYEAMAARAREIAREED